MSELVGHLTVVGRGGLDVFIFEDAMVRAWCGMGTALSAGALNAGSSGGLGALGAAASAAVAHRLRGRFKGERLRLSQLTPEEIAAENGGKNRLVLARDVQQAVVSKKWWNPKERRMVMTMQDGSVLTWKWAGAPGKGMNPDEEVLAALRLCLGDSLQVELT